MTRINCVPVAELSRAHLVAEYRELPRLVGLASAAWPERRREVERSISPVYTLGPGHVLFFYNKLAWARYRFDALVTEMRARNYRPQFYFLPPDSCGPAWHAHWTPTPAALALNRARLAERAPSLLPRSSTP